MTHSFPTRRSSDLSAGGVRAVARRGGAGAPCGRGVSPRARVHRDSRLSADARQHREDIAGAHPAGRCDREKPRDETHPGDDGRACKRFGGERSEEHTSELQSLMRRSYAVFCLKKKKQTFTSQNACIHNDKYTKRIQTEKQAT